METFLWLLLTVLGAVLLFFCVIGMAFLWIITEVHKIMNAPERE